MSIDGKLEAKILKIAAMMNGANNGGEAIAAAAALQRLCAEHNLSQTEVADVIGSHSKGRVEEEIADTVADIEGWRKRLAAVIAENFRCKSYISKLPSHAFQQLHSIIFVGFRDDLTLAITCYKITVRAMQCIFIKHLMKMGLDGEAHSDSYYSGFIQGLSSVYRKQLETNETMAIIMQTPSLVQLYYDNLNLGKADPWVFTKDPDVASLGFADGYSFGEGTNIQDESLVCF